MLDRVLDTIDLNRLIVERVNIDGVVATVDVDEIVSRVDIDAIVSRIDIDKIAASIDLDAIVARIDIDGIVETVDVEAIIERVNVVEIAEDVINEIDLPEIIRDSTGSMASQVVRDHGCRPSTPTKRSRGWSTASCVVNVLVRQTRPADRSRCLQSLTDSTTERADDITS